MSQLSRTQKIVALALRDKNKSVCGNPGETLATAGTSNSDCVNNYLKKSVHLPVGKFQIF